MKQKDIGIIVIAVVFSAILSIVASRLIFKPGDRKQQVEVVQTITEEFPTPDQRFFNSKSIDPTLSIQIGDNSNTDPFKGTTGQ